MAITLMQTRLANGRWEGVLAGVTGPVPTVEAWHQDRLLPGLTVEALAGHADRHAVRLDLPLAVLSEGVQTVVFRVAGEVLATVTLVAGAPLDEDLRAEIALLRAELDLLKRAFRRHCADTAG